MQKQLADKAAVIEKKGLAALRSHERESAGENSAPIAHEMAMKPLKGDFAKKMLAKLNSKAKHLADAAWHDQVTAVTTKDLGTATWPSAKQIEARDDDSMAVDTTLQGKGKALRKAKAKLTPRGKRVGKAKAKLTPRGKAKLTPRKLTPRGKAKAKLTPRKLTPRAKAKMNLLS